MLLQSLATLLIGFLLPLILYVGLHTVNRLASRLLGRAPLYVDRVRLPVLALAMPAEMVAAVAPRRLDGILTTPKAILTPS